MSLPTITIKAAPGVPLRHPDAPHELVDAAGASVAWSVYWQRRIDAGEALLVAPAAAQAEAPERPIKPAAEPAAEAAAKKGKA